MARQKKEVVAFDYLVDARVSLRRALALVMAEGGAAKMSLAGKLGVAVMVVADVLDAIEVERLTNGD